MYSDVVLGIGHEHFEEFLDDHKERQGYTLDTDLTADDWAELVERYKSACEDEPASRSRRTRTSSCGARSAPCSARG